MNMSLLLSMMTSSPVRTHLDVCFFFSSQLPPYDGKKRTHQQEKSLQFCIKKGMSDHDKRWGKELAHLRLFVVHVA